MKEIIRNKLNRGVTLTDLVIAILIIGIFTGILTSGFTKIYRNNIYIKENEQAQYYAIRTLEDIDRMPYENVTNTLNLELAEKYNIDENYLSINIENYNKDDPNKEDIIKIVTVTINYKVLNQDIQYSLKKVKIKEIWELVFTQSCVT